MARKNKNKDIQKAEMPKAPERRPFDEDTLDFVELEVYRKEKGELHEQDPRKPINAEGGGGPERLDLLKRLSVFRGKGDTPVKKAAEGGSMTKQMEMFEDGGLKDEGGMTDEVSGNDVPIGSTREEVRDDIPAQLSEGEFVFPADVVRFMGLEKLMMMRQKAKEGLKKMEDMGQMGNSEEATLPDDIPFTMDDLDMEDDMEEEVSDSNFNRGGVVTMAEGGTTPTTENTDLDNKKTTPNESNMGINNETKTKQQELNPRQANVPVRGSDTATPFKQSPLNVRQQKVTMRDSTTDVSDTNKAIPTGDTFLKKKSITETGTNSLEDAIPDNLGSRFTTSNKQKSINETNEELQSLLSINPYESNNNNDSDSSSTFSDGIPQGGINYEDTQRFDLPDKAREMLNEFSKSQLSMFAVANPLNSAFSVIASAAGAGLADVTKGKSADIIGGPIMTAEKGKARAIAFNTAMIDIQRDFGIKVGTPMQDWPLKAQNQIGIRGEYALKTGTAIHNARYNLPFESNLTEKEISFIEKAKEKFSSLSKNLKGDSDTEKPDYTNPINSVDGVGIGKSTGEGSTTIGTEDVDATKASSDRAYYDAIGELLAAELSNEKIGNTEMGITQGGFEDSSAAGDLIELGFDDNTRDEISANGGSIGIGYNDNGQAYSKNENGSFTHSDGTTVNFTDNDGNPGNAPPTPTPSVVVPPPPPPTPPTVYTPPPEDNNDNNGGNDGTDGGYGGPDNTTDYGGT